MAGDLDPRLLGVAVSITTTASEAGRGTRNGTGIRIDVLCKKVMRAFR
jgi:hypothetical protein